MRFRIVKLLCPSEHAHHVWDYALIRFNESTLELGMEDGTRIKMPLRVDLTA